ncbi:hypothetical protein F5141DRAFT_1063570 [Pisolithus sp. B1]|nr:hypothetical protein F5141DRAFT_1063570 [Pisolithus sp. B1]
MMEWDRLLEEEWLERCPCLSEQKLNGLSAAGEIYHQTAWETTQTEANHRRGQKMHHNHSICWRFVVMSFREGLWRGGSPGLSGSHASNSPVLWSLYMQSSAVSDFLVVAEGHCVSPAKPNSVTKIYHCVYTTALHCAGGASIPGGLHIYSPFNGVVVPDNTGLHKLPPHQEAASSSGHVPIAMTRVED